MSTLPPLVAKAIAGCFPSTISLILLGSVHSEPLVLIRDDFDAGVIDNLGLESKRVTYTWLGLLSLGVRDDLSGNQRLRQAFLRI